MRIVVCWTDLSGYVAACFRALAAQKDIELLVLLFAPGKQLDQAFSDDLLRGLNVRLLQPIEREDAQLVRSIVAAHKPQVIVVPGWLHPPYKQLASLPEFAQTQFIMTMDNPWKGSLRQRLGRFKIGGYLKRMNAVFAAGERAWQFARQLGVPETKIYRGVYGFDLPAFEGVYDKRLAQGPWPKQFLFMGRYVPVKGLDYLLPAYRKYRGMVSDPWPITFCGQGPLQNQIAAEQGAQDFGFVQPADQPGVMLQHGVFVLSSTYEPWGVALAEAMASGLPAICTEEVGAGVDLVRTCHNGLMVPSADIDGLADGLKWMHDHYDRLPEMGWRAREFAAAHSAELWAQRVLRMIEKIMQ